jgi:hypothetical protein
MSRPAPPGSIDEVCWQWDSYHLTADEERQKDVKIGSSRRRDHNRRLALPMDHDPVWECIESADIAERDVHPAKSSLQA